MVEATCHCGAVRIAFPKLDLASARRCDCSMCRRRGAIAVTVPREDLTIVSGETLRLYQFHTHTAEHYFCSVCGIYTHHRRRSNPNECGVNIACVDGVDIRSVEWSWVDGANHENDRIPET
ncbi:GFA family protein [Acuticoccus sp. M5D2P5]|uniref:GFA family protein n=1 Tax=Acuticoccus kalidii TaxID=2910977 RepID=UPI001F1C0E69|nr:GFA family protein [Acuticoccus kalidii]MCF3936237.1 GFA family protein [Acuticoccus kalidii]